MSFKFGDESANLDFSVGGDDGAVHENAAPAPRATPSVPSPPARIPGPPPRMPKAPLPAARPLTPAPLPAPARPAPQPEPVYEQPAEVDNQWDGYEEEEVSVEAPVAAPVERPRQPDAARRPTRSFDEAVEASTPPRAGVTPFASSTGYDEEDAYYEEEQQPRRQARQPRPAPRVAEEHVPAKGKGRKTSKTAGKKKGPKGPSDWAGGRKKVLIARIVIFSLLGLLVFAGIRSFLPQASTLTPDDQATVISNVRMELGITDFPATTGESVALGFTEAYLSYGVNSREQRETQLLRYVPEEILNSIDVRFASEGDLAEANAPVVPESTDPAAPADGEGDDHEPDVQTVTGGPYVMGRTMVAGGESAIYTTATEVNDDSWIYMQVPLFYDAETNSVSVSGSPSFTDGPKAGPVPNDLFLTEWSDDPEVEAAIEADIPNYFRAWGASDTAAIERLVLKENGEIAASENAIRGLNGALRFIRVDDIRVEAKPRPEENASQEEIADFRTREARVTVTWLEPSSNLVYSQTYAMKLAYTNENWFIEDVENQGVTLGQSRERL